jgi:hypothetical protein
VPTTTTHYLVLPPCPCRPWIHISKTLVSVATCAGVCLKLCGRTQVSCPDISALPCPGGVFGLQFTLSTTMTMMATITDQGAITIGTLHVSEDTVQTLARHCRIDTAELLLVYAVSSLNLSAMCDCRQAYLLQA